MKRRTVAVRVGLVAAAIVSIAVEAPEFRDDTAEGRFVSAMRR